MQSAIKNLIYVIIMPVIFAGAVAHFFKTYDIIPDEWQNGASISITSGEGVLGNAALTGPNFFVRQGNSVRTTDGAIDFSVGGAASSSADFAIDPGNNTIIINGILYTFPTNDGDANQVLHTDGSGTLSWNTDDTGVGGGASGTIDMRDGYSGAFTNIGSISYNTAHFGLNISTTLASLSLDWTNGPASRSIAQTISGLWTFTGGASFTAPFELSNTASISGNVTMNNNGAFLWLDGGPDLTEYSAIIRLGGDTKDSYRGGYWRYDSNDNFTTFGAHDANDTNTANDVDVWRMDREPPYTLEFLQNASATINFEVAGYASASLFQGSAFSGNPDCNDAGDKLLWSAGLFTCGTLSVADTSATGGTGIDINTNDFVFDGTELEAITWGAGGNSSNLWTFNLTSGDPTLNWTQSGATLSLNFEAIGYASASKFFTADLGSGALTNNQFGIDNGGFGQFVYRASGSEHTLSDEKTMFMSIGSTSFNTWTSRSIGYMFRGRTIKRIQCKVSSATSIVIRLSANGTADTESITCATTNTFDDGSIANATISKGADLVLERGTITGEVDFLEISVTYVDTRE